MSASANDNSSRSAQEVGWIFVREYCNHLREKPESLFQFYDKQASLIYGLEGEEVKICQGQQVYFRYNKHYRKYFNSIFYLNI
jgi:hypothetical protein